MSPGLGDDALTDSSMPSAANIDPFQHHPSASTSTLLPATAFERL
jgi:hypothetical protein